MAGLCGAVTAQPFNFDISFALGTPQGSFSNTLERNLYGLDMGLTYQVPGTPIHLGAGVLYQNYGWRERKDYFSGDIHSVDVRVRTTNDMIAPHLIMRIEAPVRAFRALSPFLEGMIGLNYMYTQSRIVNDWEDEYANTINHDFTTSTYGIGGGLRIDLFDVPDEDGDYYKVAFIAKTRYMVGGEAMYLKEGDLVSTSSGLNYTVRRSRTDMITLNFGFVLSF